MLPGVPREAKDIATYAVILEDMGCKPFFVSNESAEINRTDLYIDSCRDQACQWIAMLCFAGPAFCSS